MESDRAAVVKLGEMAVPGFSEALDYIIYWLKLSLNFLSQEKDWCRSFVGPSFWDIFIRT